MSFFVPKQIFFTKGAGVHRDHLTSFEMALRDAGIAPFNLVTVSSIFPPYCQIVDRETGLKQMHAGQIAFAVMARNASNEPRRLIGASIGVALPSDPDHHGYLAEYHPYGETEQEAGEYASRLAADMLASAVGFQPDPDLSYLERAERYRRAGILSDSFHVTQVAVRSPTGDWTTVMAAAVMLLDSD